MRIREATAEDAEDIYAVHTSAITDLAADAYDQAVVDAWAGSVDPSSYGLDADEEYFVVADRGRTVGFGSLSDGPSPGYGTPIDAEVTAVYVHPGAARDGVGSGILGAPEAEARGSGVRTVGLTASVNAVGFYESQGYGSTREVSYPFGGTVEAPAVEMVKRL